MIFRSYALYEPSNQRDFLFFSGAGLLNKQDIYEHEKLAGDGIM